MLSQQVRDPTAPDQLDRPTPQEHARRPRSSGVGPVLWGPEPVERAPMRFRLISTKGQLIIDLW